MVQGKSKNLNTKSRSGSDVRRASKAAAHTKKGLTYIPPKKTILVKQAALKKDLTAKINKSIERQMCSAASSGKLTIMKNVAPVPASTHGKGKAKSK